MNTQNSNLAESERDLRILLSASRNHTIEGVKKA